MGSPKTRRSISELPPRDLLKSRILTSRSTDEVSLWDVCNRDVRFTPPKADMCGALAHGRYGPKADIGLIDHLVCKRNQPWWNGNAQCFGGVKIDHEFKFRRLKYR